MPKSAKLQKLSTGAAAAQGPLSASVWNALVEVVQGLASLQGGAGIKVTFVGQIPVVAIEDSRELQVEGIIKAAHGGAGPGMTSTFTYDIAALGRPDIALLTNRTPDEGRPVRNDEVEIYPAKVGDRASIIVEPKPDGTFQVTKVRVYTEAIAFGPCAASLAAAPTVEELAAAVTSLSARLAALEAPGA